MTGVEARVTGLPDAASRGGAVVRRAIGLIGALPLHAKLFLGMAVPLIGLVMVGLAAVVRIERGLEREAFVESLESAVVAMTNEFHRVTLLRDQSAAVEASERLRAFHDIERLWVLTESGELSFAYARPGLLPSPPPEPGALTAPRRLTVPLCVRGRSLGTAVLEVALDRLEAAHAARLVNTGAIAGAMLLVGLGIAFVLGRLIAAPIRRISEFVVATATTLDTSRRLPVTDRHETGALAGSINRLLAEITDQRTRLEETNARIEAVVEQRTRDLRASERRIRALATHAPVGIFETDLGGMCLFVNRAWAELTRLTPDQALGRSWTEVVHPEDRDAVREAWRDAVEARNDFTAEFRVVAGDGRTAWVCGGTVALRDEAGAITGHLGTLTDMTERKQLEEELRFGAFHDRLTSLPNRAWLRERLTAAIERSKADPGFRYAVLYLDFDRFKQINDTLGHEAGDGFLAAAAERIAGTVHSVLAGRALEATTTRLGGDEFVVLLEGIEDAGQVVRTAEALCDALAAPYRIGGSEVVSTASIGVVLAESEYAAPDDVLRDADAAMYRRKSEGRRGVTLFDWSMREAAVSRARLEEDLRVALERGEFLLHYQPIVSLQDRRPAGFEALLRWRRATRGLVQPGEFLAIAEETRLVIPIGRWALREACVQAKRWLEWMPEPEPRFVSVNISRHHVEDGAILDDVEHALGESGLPPRALVIEVTENTIMHDVKKSAGVLARLRECGVRVSMDDFGTGHSSLAYLRQLPLDMLKIDRSFVTGLTPDKKSMAILQAIIDLASNLGVRVVAEGVETPDQIGPLIALDCQLVQGFAMARPMPAEDVPAWCVRAAAPRARVA